MDSRPFDPEPLLLAYIHARACPGHGEGVSVEPADCLFIAEVVADFRAGLAKAGLGLVPLAGVRFLERRFAEILEEDLPEPEEPASGDSQSEARAREQVWLRTTARNGAVVRSGPHPRWWAEILLGDLALDHGPDTASARIEPEPAWIWDLLSDLGGNDQLSDSDLA